VPVDPALWARGLTYTYPGGPTALQEICFQAAPGETIGLVGPNGAGKTTLFLCLAGVLPVSPGTVEVGGLDPGDKLQRRRLPTKVGIVFQDSDNQIFNTTVFDDVAFGPLNLGLPPEEVKQRVAEAVGRVGLTGLERRVPFHLSGGEKRRVALGGVLAMRPDVLLLDEPSTHLDPRGRRDLIALIRSIEATRVIASHDLEMILQTFGRVLLLDAGRLIPDGPARALLADHSLMEGHGLEVPYSLR